MNMGCSSDTPVGKGKLRKYEMRMLSQGLRMNGVSKWGRYKKAAINPAIKSSDFLLG